MRVRIPTAKGKKKENTTRSSISFAFELQSSITINKS